eukprot:6330310-Prorocentrum_lima.AAC.1
MRNRKCGTDGKKGRVPAAESKKYYSQTLEKWHNCVRNFNQVHGQDISRNMELNIEVALGRRMVALQPQSQQQ